MLNSNATSRHIRKGASRPRGGRYAPPFLRTPKEKRKTHIDADKSAEGAGAYRFGRSHALARPLPLALPRLVPRHFFARGSSAHARVMRPQLVRPRPLRTFVAKQNKCSVLKSAASPHFFPYSEKFFVPHRLPLILLETTQGFYFRADALSLATAPAPTLFFVSTLRIARPPLRRGRTFAFACPPAGAR